MNMDFSIIKGMFKTNADIFDKVTQAIPQEQWLTQPCNDSNHLTWVAGHVVVHRAIVAEMLGAQWSAPWRKLFVRGAKRVSPDQYPDADALMGAAAEHARRRLVLTYPQQHLVMRLGLRAINLWLRLSGCGFRTYVHPFERILAPAERNGLSLERRERQGFFWESAALVR